MLALNKRTVTRVSDRYCYKEVLLLIFILRAYRHLRFQEQSILTFLILRIILKRLIINFRSNIFLYIKPRREYLLFSLSSPLFNTFWNLTNLCCNEPEGEERANLLFMFMQKERVKC